MNINLNDKIYDDLTDERQQELGDLLKGKINNHKKKEIQTELFNRHIRLAHRQVMNYLKSGVEYDDLFNSACLALWRCVLVWEADSGPLYPWALRWIKTALNREVDSSRKIKIPETLAYKRALADKYKNEENLTDEEIIKLLDIPKEKFDQLKSLPEALNLLETQNEYGIEFKEIIASKAIDPAQEVEIKELKDLLYEALELLEPIEQEVIKSRFELDGNRRQTLAEIGRRYQVGREAMRRVEAGAIAKLRHPSFPIPLNTLLDLRN